MDEPESLNHTRWECKHHVVFIPKCRRKTFCAYVVDHINASNPRLSPAEAKSPPFGSSSVLKPHCHCEL
jgi:putative transposase